MFPYCTSHSPFNLDSYPPDPAPPTPTGSSSPSFSPSSNSSQDVHLESSGSIPFSVNHRSPSICSPLRGRNLKDHLEQLEQLKKDNFDLKLRIYFLEDRLSHRNKGDKEGIYNANIELKVENEAMKKELCDKQELIRQAADLMTTLEKQFKEQQESTEESHRRETEELNDRIKNLQMELNELKSCREDGLSDLTQLCNIAFGSEKSEVTQLPVQQCEAEFSNGTISSAVSEEAIPETAKFKIKELEEEVLRLTEHIQSLETDIDEKSQFSEALQEDISNLKREFEDYEDKMLDLEQEVVEKDQKIDHLMQDLETRHLEIVAKESTIINLNEDLSKVSPQIEVKVQEIKERDRIIEEKSGQIEQQNKILVEIQITLDEKQKHITDLEDALVSANEQTQSLDKELNTSLYTIKSMTEDLLARDKQISLLRKNLKKEERKVKILLAEHKEVLDMLKKEKWGAEMGTAQDDVREMAEDENERLWAELEQKKAEITKLQTVNEAILKEAKERESELLSQKGEMESKILSLKEQLEELTKKNKSISSDPNKSALLEKMELRERELQSQTTQIESLQTQLMNAKIELNERTSELKRLKLRFLGGTFDPSNLLSKELDDRNKTIKDLFNKLFDQPSTEENTVKLVKQLIESYQSDKNQSPPKSNSLTNLEIQSNVSVSEESEEIPQSNSKSGRSNNFSLLENSLFAHMGQKMVNNNQTFNTYVISNNPFGMDAENELSCNELAGNTRELQSGSESDLPHRTTDCSGEDSAAAAVVQEDNVVSSCLQKEIVIFKNEVNALKNDRLRLDKEIDSFRTMIQSKLSNEDNCCNSSSDKGEMVFADKMGAGRTSDPFNSLFPCLFFTKYQTIVKKYKTDTTSLRNRLSESQNSCALLRNRLEELVDFFEQLLDMEKKGILNLSHLSNYDRSALQKSLDDSRALSMSLSQSLMIGMDSVLSVDLRCENETIDNTVHNNSTFNISLLENEEDQDMICSCSTFCSTLLKCNEGLRFKIEELNELANKLSHIESSRQPDDVNAFKTLPSHQTKSNVYMNDGLKQMSSALVDCETPQAVALHSNMSHDSFKEYSGSESPKFSIETSSMFVNVSSIAHMKTPLQINTVSRQTPANFIMEPSANNKVTVHSQSKLSFSNNSNLFPSENDVWSEPDRDASFARIGLEECNTSFGDQHDQLVSCNSNSSVPSSEIDEQSKTSRASLIAPSCGNIVTKITDSENSEVKRLNSSIKNFEQKNVSSKGKVCPYVRSGEANEGTEELLLLLKDCQEKLAFSRDLEFKLKNLLKESETKVFELNAKVADYLACNHSLEQKVVKQVEELRQNEEKIKFLEGELKQISTSYNNQIAATKNEQNSQENQTQKEIVHLRNAVKEKVLEIEKQQHHIFLLEDARSDSELKLQEQKMAINNLCASFNILTKESAKASTADYLVLKLKEALMSNEDRLLLVTKEKFSLVNDKTLLQSQLDSLKMESEIMKKSSNTTTIESLTHDLNSALEFVKMLEGQFSLTEDNNPIGDSGKMSLNERIMAVKNKLFVFLNCEEQLSLKSAFEDLKLKFSSLEREKNALLSRELQNEEKLKAFYEQTMEISRLQKELNALQLLNRQIQSSLNSQKTRSRNLEIKFKNLSSDVCRCKTSEVSSNGGPRSSVLSPSKQVLPSVSEDKENIHPTLNSNSLEVLDHRIVTKASTLCTGELSASGTSPDLGIEVSDGRLSSSEVHKSPSRCCESKNAEMLDRRFDGVLDEKNSQNCYEPGHNSLIVDIERLQRENKTLSSKMSEMETQIRDARNQLSNATRRKEAIDKAMYRQLTKTHRVLKQTKGNLRLSRQTNQVDVNSLPASQSQTVSHKDSKLRTGK